MKKEHSSSTKAALCPDLSFLLWKNIFLLWCKKMPYLSGEISGLEIILNGKVSMYNRVDKSLFWCRCLVLKCWILSLFTAIKGCLSEFGFISIGRALSSQPTPYQVLKLKYQKLQIDNVDDSTKRLSLSWNHFHFFKLSVQNLASGHYQGDVTSLGKSPHQEQAPVTEIWPSCSKNKRSSSSSPPTPLCSSCRYFTLLLVL